MKIDIKDPQRTKFIRTLIIILICLVVGGGLLYIAYVTLGGAAALWQGIKNLIADLWHKKPFDCIMLFIGLGLVLLGLLSAPFMAYDHFKRWRNAKRVRALNFAPEGVYIISDINVLLPYEQTALNLLIHIDSSYSAKNRVRTPYIAYLKFVFTYENTTYAIKHVAGKKLLYRLADTHSAWKRFSFNTSMEHFETREEQALAKHLTAQLENQMRYGLHCNYVHRSRLLFAAVILDVIAAYLCIQGMLLGKIMLFMWVAVGILSSISVILLVLWARDTQMAKKIERLSGKKQ